MIGILKSGGAYLPIDPEYPEERIDYILEDSGVQILITKKDLENKYLGFRGELIFIEEEEYKEHFIRNLNVKFSSDNLAYIIYTSGSTGKPKGVSINHRGVVNYLNYIVSEVISVDAKNFIYMNALCTDLGYTSLFSSLVRGNRLCIISPKKELEIPTLLELLWKEKIDVIKTTPSYYNVLSYEIENCSKDLIFRLDNVIQRLQFILGGEVLPQDYISLNRNIINHYGPTETTVGVCVNNSLKVGVNSVAIGKPISNMQIYILDKDLNLLPIGSIGEIYIGGVGLARGYLNKPGMTADKFIPNPFVRRGIEGYVGDGEGSRLYRSGDLGRYLTDGNIEYVGRIDHQVKIRGYRVELGEIEKVILEVPGVKQVVVIVKEDDNVQKSLLSYIILEDNRAKEEIYSELVKLIKTSCEERLPGHMQPNHIMLIDEFPLTVSGKLDKEKLPKPKDREGMEIYQTPIGIYEERLAEIWSELLGAQNISRNDNFFNLGGHSIKTIQLISLAKNSGFDITISDVFNYPILRKLSLILSKKSNSFENAQELCPLTYKMIGNNIVSKENKIFDTLIPIKLTDGQEYMQKLFIIHPGGGLAFNYISLTPYIRNDMFGINNPCFTKPDDFISVEEIAQHYIEEILKVQPEGPYFIAGYSFGGIVAYEISKKIGDGNKIILIDTTVDFSKTLTKTRLEKHCEDEIVNKYIDLNIAHSNKLSLLYKFENNDNNILFLKNGKNKSTLKHLCKNYQEVVMPGNHSNILTLYAEDVAKEINKFL